MSSKCERCGRSDERPIVLHSEDRERSFCSTECLELEGREEGVNLWLALRRERDAMSAKLEEKRGSKVISLIHREEMRDEENQYITIDNTEELLRKIRSVPPETPIDLIIHCP